MSMPFPASAFGHADRIARIFTGAASCGTMRVIANCVANGLALFPL
jgi:hypothetical protein